MLNTIAIEIFANALGMSEAEMFKQMEMGKILAEDVLPLVGKEYSKVARANGALAKASEKVNSQLQRFLNALQEAKLAIFGGGFGQSMANIFKDMAAVITDMLPAIKTFGAFLGGALEGIYHSVKVLLVPFRILLNGLESMFGEKTAKILGMATGFFLVTRAVYAMAAALAAANLSMATLNLTAARFLPIMAALGIEDIFVNARGGQSVSGRMGLSQSAAGSIAKSSEFTAATGSLAGLVGYAANQVVKIVFDGEEAKKFIRVEAEGTMTNSQANLASQLGG